MDRQSIIRPVSREREAARNGELSPDSSELTRLTPDSGSDTESDLDVEMGELGGESYKLQQHPRHTSEKAVNEDEDDDEDGDEGTYGDGRMGRRGSASTVQSYQLYTPDEERAVVKKFDRNLVLFVAVLYMLSFLDRSSMFPLSCYSWSIVG